MPFATLETGNAHYTAADGFGAPALERGSLLRLEWSRLDSNWHALIHCRRQVVKLFIGRLRDELAHVDVEQVLRRRGCCHLTDAPTRDASAQAASSASARVFSGLANISNRAGRTAARQTHTFWLFPNVCSLHVGSASIEAASATAHDSSRRSALERKNVLGSDAMRCAAKPIRRAAPRFGQLPRRRLGNVSSESLISSFCAR